MQLTQVAVILIAANPAFAQAQALFSTGFESPTYSIRGLTGQDSWYTFSSANAGNPQVQTTVVRTGSQAISVNASGAAGYSLHTLTYSDSGTNKIVEGSIQLNLASHGTSWNGLCFLGGNDESDPTVGCLNISTFGVPFVTNYVNPAVGGAALATGTWNELRLRLDFAAQTMTGFVNGNPLGTIPFRKAVRTLAAVGFGFGTAPGSNIAYYDDLSVSASASAPPVPLPTDLSSLSTGFEAPGYSLRGLTGQNSWYTYGSGNAGNPQVQNTVVRAGSRAVSVNASGAAGYSLHEFSYSDSGANKIVEGSIQLNLASLGTVWNGLCFIARSDFNPTLGCLSINTTGFPFITNLVNPIVGPTALRTGTWNEIRLRLNFTAQTMTGFVNGTAIGTVPFRAAASTLAAVGFGFNSVPGSNIAFYDDLSVTASASAPPLPLPTFRSAQPLLQSFSGRPGLSSGTWVELYGTNLSTTTREWACADFTANCTQAPTALDGVRVNINNRPAFVRYVSPTQINAQVPDDGGATGPVQITVTNSLGTSAPITMNKTAESPALLTTPSFLVGGKQYVAALYSDNATFVGPVGLIPGAAFRPAKVGDVIIVYAVGCGATNPARPTGTVLAAPVPVAGTVRVSFGQTPAPVQAFVSALGLCQLNVTVPSVPSGDIAISTSVNDTAARQTLFTTIE